MAVVGRLKGVAVRMKIRGTDDRCSVVDVSAI